MGQVAQTTAMHIEALRAKADGVTRGQARTWDRSAAPRRARRHDRAKPCWGWPGSVEGRAGRRWREGWAARRALTSETSAALKQAGHASNAHRAVPGPWACTGDLRGGCRRNQSSQTVEQPRISGVASRGGSRAARVLVRRAGQDEEQILRSKQRGRNQGQAHAAAAVSGATRSAALRC